MICIPGATPIVLRDHVELPIPATVNPYVLQDRLLQHPEDRAVIIDEILFSATLAYELHGLNVPLPADLAAALEVEVALGKWFLTDGFVPIGLFDKVNPRDPTKVISALSPAVNTTQFQNQTYFLWRLTDPVYVPQGVPFHVNVRRNPTTFGGGLWGACVLNLSFVARGVALPAGHKVPDKTSVPWVTAADTLLATNTPWMSSGNELKNTLDKAMQLDYAVGQLLDIGLDGTCIRNVSFAPENPTIRLASSAWDTDPVPLALPFNTVFNPQTNKLWLGRPMDIGERITAETTVGALAYPPYFGLSLVGRRYEEIL